MKFLTFLMVVLTFATVSSGQKNKAKPLAENFIATSLSGQEINLDLLKGKIVLVTFWSTRCPICAAEIPKLNQLVDKFKNQEVVFLALTPDNKDKVESYNKKKPFKFDLLPNTFGVLLLFADKDGDGKVTMPYPSHFLINQKGEIELKTSGFDKTGLLAAQINRLLTVKQTKAE